MKHELMWPIEVGEIWRFFEKVVINGKYVFLILEQKWFILVFVCARWSECCVRVFVAWNNTDFHTLPWHMGAYSREMFHFCEAISLSTVDCRTYYYCVCSVVASLWCEWMTQYVLCRMWPYSIRVWASSQIFVMFVVVWLLYSLDSAAFGILHGNRAYGINKLISRVKLVW